MTAAERNRELAKEARKHGARYAWTIVTEARRAGIPISLGFALIEQESNFENVFGHDQSIFRGAGKVTKAKYEAYKRERGTPGRRMQGVGPPQLTWWELQDEADRRGGCHVAKHSIRVAFEHLAALIRQHGTAVGIERYNGSGPAARRYRAEVQTRQAQWHQRLT